MNVSTGLTLSSLRIPNEILQHICSYLPRQSLNKLGQVDRHFRGLAEYERTRRVKRFIDEWDKSDLYPQELQFTKDRWCPEPLKGDEEIPD